MRQGILVTLMFLVLAIAPTPSVPKPKPPSVKADKVVALKPFTPGSPGEKREVITRTGVDSAMSYQAFPSEPVFTLPVQAMRVEEQKKPVVADAVPKPPSAKAEVRRENDICRGKGRSYYNNGRSWRCNR